MKISYSPSFVRAYKKYLKNQPDKQQLFLQKVGVFIEDPFNPQLKTHKLKGILKDFFAFSLAYNIRVIFYFASDTEVIFEDIGTHDEVY